MLVLDAIREAGLSLNDYEERRKAVQAALQHSPEKGDFTSGRRLVSFACDFAHGLHSDTSHDHPSAALAFAAAWGRSPKGLASRAKALLPKEELVYACTGRLGWLKR